MFYSENMKEDQMPIRDKDGEDNIEIERIEVCVAELNHLAQEKV
jgi:hypothetical protein